MSSITWRRSSKFSHDTWKHLLSRSRKLKNGCRVWRGCRTKKGYGQIGVGHGRNEYVHRTAWKLKKGKIPKGLCVLHRCDNPSCFEIRHLFLGTKATNNADMARKGRHYRQKQTHCLRGHLLSGNNLKPMKSGARQCRACVRITNRISKGWPKKKAFLTPLIRKVLTDEKGRFRQCY